MVGPDVPSPHVGFSGAPPEEPLLRSAGNVTYTGPTPQRAEGRPTQEIGCLAVLTLGGLAGKFVWPAGFARDVALATVHVTEDELRSRGAHGLRRKARLLEEKAPLRYLVLGLEAPSYGQRAFGRRGTDLRRARDRALRAVAFEAISGLPEWRVVWITPGRSRLLEGSTWRTLRGGTGPWLDTSVTSGPGEPRFEMRLRGCRAPRQRKQRRAPEQGALQASALAARCVLEDFMAESPGEPELTETGRVVRHRLRGGPVHDAKAERRAEDAASQAGMRDPALLVDTWPELWDTMARVEPSLQTARGAHPELQGMHRCLGDAPSAVPPTEAILTRRPPSARRRPQRQLCRPSKVGHLT